MLKVDIEYKKGILFVRLIGKFNKSTINEVDIVDNIIKKAGIKYILFNFEKAIINNKKDVYNFINKYNSLIGKEGKLVICGYNPMKLKVNTEDIYLSNREIYAFNIVNI